MTLDVVRFLDTRGIEYVTRGPNVARGHVNIRCPLCGPADPSHHFGIRLSDCAWGCFRNPAHRGRSVVRLVQVVLGCTDEAARAIVDEASPVPTARDLRRKFDEIEKRRGRGKRGVEWHPSLREFEDADGWPESIFHRHLRERGFGDDTAGLADYYGLRWAVTGKWSHRIVFPLRDVDGSLLGWTGRVIARSRAKYRTFPEDESVRGYVWNADRAAAGGRILVVAEGPFDAMKLDWYGHALGLRAIALLGLSCGPARTTLIADLSDVFERVVVMTDADADRATISLVSTLAVVGVERVPVPGGKDDPGDLTRLQVRNLAENLLSEIP